jgi:hypothetical protein
LAVVPIVAIQVVVIVVVAVFRLQRSSQSFRSYYNFIKLVFFVTVTPDKKKLKPLVGYNNIQRIDNQFNDTQHNNNKIDGGKLGNGEGKVMLGEVELS